MRLSSPALTRILLLLGALLAPWSGGAASAAQPSETPADSRAESRERSVAPMPSLAPMIRRVSPSVVSIGIQGTVREQGPRNPLLDDPFFRRFFNVPPDAGARERPFH